MSVSAAQIASLRATLLASVDAAARGLSPQEREDLVQTVLTRLWPRIAREGVAHYPASYLHKAAFNALMDHLRAIARRRETCLEDAPVPIADAIAPEHEYRHGALREAIADCLTGMVEARRRAVVLHLQGHGVPETAELLGWRRKRAENAVYRGLAHLRRCLAGKGWDADGSD